MTLLRRLGCEEIWLAVAVFVIGTAVSNNVAGMPPPAKQARSDDPTSPDYRYRVRSEYEGGTDRDKLLASIKETLGTFMSKPSHTKKGGEDLFVVGTIDLQNRHATVDFVIKEGVQQTADFIADFVLGKAPDAIREWKVFSYARTMKVAEGLRAKAKSESVESRLAVFKRSTAGRISTDDYFVVGTADLNLATLHADIRFEILSGVKTAADFVIDFIFNRSETHKGEWHVFFRARTEAEATEYRQQLRDWYDSLAAQRAQIAAIYRAKTTARC
jgi:hypothetical protein